jgi:hypothetical protein
VLSAPGAWTRLLEPAWARLVEHVPPGYELVVRPVGPASPHPPVAGPVALGRAA